MLICDADVRGHGRADVRIAGSRIAAIGQLKPLPGEPLLHAHGGAFLPGLHDHHIHLAAMAARRNSVTCGPPEVFDEEGLAKALSRPGSGWLRGIGFHESVLGTLPDATTLDRFVSDRPLRIQHRTGRMWLLNTPALETLLAIAPPPPGLERDDRGFTGRLFEEDSWLQATLGSAPPDLGEVSAELARYGVTGLTDMSPRNDPVMVAHFVQQIESGSVVQHCTLAGALSLADSPAGPWHIGPAKLHLHEAALPDFDETIAFIAAAHAQSRGVAVHCVSEVELVFALAALEGAGTRRGDRVEHASVASPELVAQMAALGLQVCVQPHFIAERGDRYLADVEPRHHGDLYRLRSLADHGIVLAGGSDAPFGSADPWAAMAAAVDRTTTAGTVIGGDEALDPDAALALYLADPADLSRERRIAVGGEADLCLLHRPWQEARQHLDASLVRTTIVSGRIVHESVDESPIERLPRSNALA